MFDNDKDYIEVHEICRIRLDILEDCGSMNLEQ